jgi:hypothetical protein
MRLPFAGFLFIVTAAAFPATGTAQDQVPAYSNSDVERFRQPSDSRPAQPMKETKGERKADARTAKDNIERERWCKRATAQRDEIEKAQYEVQVSEKKLRQEEKKDFHGGKKTKQLQERLALAKRKLAGEEKELTDIENEAHRKGVPPGWLRCQVD